MLTPVKSKAPANIKPSLFPVGQMVPFSLVTVLFFLWGVPNNLNDVLIRQFMTSFAITRFQAGLVQSAFYLGYFLLAMPAAMLMRRAGYKTGIVTGLVLFGTGTFLFWPAAIVDRYGFFLLALFVIASGLAFLETAANPFIAEIGDAESSEQRLNFSQAFNPIGAISGVAIGTTFIFSGVELTPAQISALKASHQYAAYLQSETLRVVKPYVVLGAVAFILAAIIASVRFPETRSSSATAGKGSGGTAASPSFAPPIFHVLRRGAIPVRGCPGWDVELLHSIRTGLCASAGENRGILSDRIAGCVCHRALRIGVADAVCESWNTHGHLRYGQCGSRNDRSYTAGMDWDVGNFPHQFLYVPNVSDHLCNGPSRARRGHEARRLATGNVDCRRSGAYAIDGSDLLSKPGICLPGTSGLLRGHYGVFIRGSESFQESGTFRLRFNGEFMLKTGILNPAINSLLSRARHTNTLVIADRGFPFWPEIETVDISLVDDIPRVLDVLQAIRRNFVVGSAFMAEEFRLANPQAMQETYFSALSGISVTFEPHIVFKKHVPRAIGLIRTGDTTQYANIILESA